MAISFSLNTPLGIEMRRSFGVVAVSAFLFISAPLFADPPDVKSAQNIGYNSETRPLDCSDISNCNDWGARAYKSGDYSAAISYYTQQVALATQKEQGCAQSNQADGQCTYPPQPFNNVALATLRDGHPLMARAWINVAPPSALTQHNKMLVEKVLTGFRWPRSPAGEYWSYAGYGVWNTLRVEPAGDRFDISFEGYYFFATGLDSGPDSGTLVDRVKIVQGVAVLHGGDSSDCKITAEFKDDHVDLDTKGNDCPFGANVSAEGRYIRVSAP